MSPPRNPDGGIDSAAGWLGDWTEALNNNTTDRERQRLGLSHKDALAEYNLGAHAAVREALRRD